MGAKESRKMADSKVKLSEVAGAFEIATALHDENLTKVKDAALRHKNECEQFVTHQSKKYDQLAATIQVHLDKMRAMMDELQPKIRGIQQLEQ
jgi:hypothetical protein